MADEQYGDDEDRADETPPLRRRWRGSWVAVGVVVVAAVVAAVVLLTQDKSQEPGEFATEVAAAITAGGDDRFRSVFCASTEERTDGVDVFALARPLTVTVAEVVVEDDANAMALLDYGNPDERVLIALNREPDWCVSEIMFCTTAADFTVDPPRLPCDGLLGKD